MTENKRIALNVMATFMRSIYGIVLGLFTARWMLQALGEVNYGLFALVGGLTGFITFLNTLLSVSTSRYFAYSVGLQKITGNESSGLKECRHWFSTAVLIHGILGCMLVAVGYPVGEYVVNSVLTIPPEKLEACSHVWGLVCVSCFVNMVNVPFQAMYTAKQEIAEMTIYSFFATTANACFLYYMVNNPGDWLLRFAIWSTILTLLPLVIMAIRALVIFPECRITREGLFCFSRVKSMLGYSAAQFLADFAAMVSTQGRNIVVNKMLGPAYNAAMGIGNLVADKTLVLGTALIGAMTPAITNAAGAKDYTRMRTLSYQACKLGCVGVLFFAVPLIVEADEVFRLWLGSPPDGAAVLCVLTIIGFLLNRITSGLSAAIEALGKIAAFKVSMGVVGFIPFPMTWLFLKAGLGIAGVGYAMLVTYIPFIVLRLFFARKLAGFSVRYWLFKVFMPVVVVVALSIAFAVVPSLFMPSSFVRVVVTTCVSEVVLVPLVLLVALTSNERQFFFRRIPLVRKYAS